MADVEVEWPLPQADLDRQVPLAIEESKCTTFLSMHSRSKHNIPMNPTGALKFLFSGYAIWLEPEQFAINGSNKKEDLGQVLQATHLELGVMAIPAPHLTVVYGVSHLTEPVVRQRFRALSPLLRKRTWPMLEHEGFISGVEIDGIDEGLMSMAWIEATYKTSKDHEQLLDLIYSHFYHEEVRKGPWSPHVSLAYDNHDCPISDGYLKGLIERFPTLSWDRHISAVSLWNLEGTIDQWECLDRIELLDQDGKSTIPMS